VSVDATPAHPIVNFLLCVDCLSAMLTAVNR
jgi:hypothetical protein